MSNTLALLLLVGAAQAAQAQPLSSGRVVGVSDGDTITVVTKAKERIRIRLAEIDAPESKQAFGARSKQSLSDICYGKVASFQSTKRDRYGRVVSRVTCEGIDAQKHQIQRGMAWVYDAYVSKEGRVLYRYQTEAQKAKVGLWSDRNPTPPWEFRRKK